MSTGITVDFTLNIGIIIQTVLVIVGGAMGYGALKNMVKEIEKDMVEIKKDQRSLANTVSKMAVQDTRLGRLEQDVRDLRHGRGFFIPSEPSD